MPTEVPTTEPTSGQTDVPADYPTFSGDLPTEQDYLTLATNLVELAQSGDCAGARTLLEKSLSKDTPDDGLCSADMVNQMERVDLTDYDFQNFSTAGAFIDFVNHGVTIIVQMSFADGHVYVDGFAVY